MSAIKIIQAFAKKSLTKNQGSGITTLPSQFMAESKAGEIAAILQQAGMPLQQLDNFIRSEADLLKFLNIIKNAKPVSTSETASGVVLPFKQKRSFAEEIDAMKKSGDIVDVDDIKISEKITDRDMFNNSFLNKPTIEGQMEKITGASNKIKQIQKEQADMYKPKSDAEIAAKYDKENKESIQRFKDKMKKDDSEDKADGGRAGFYTGGITDVEPSLDDIGHGADALNARTRLMSPGSQATTSTGLNYLLAEDNDNMRIPFAGGESARYENYYIDPKTGELKKKPKLKQKAEPFYPKDFNIKDYYDPKPFYPKDSPLSEVKFAEGGRIGFSAGGGGRRAFLKLLATLGGATAAAKSGILTLGEGGAKKAITETVKQSAGSGRPPPYFFKLVEKIKFMGDDAVASQDKAIAKKYKDYVLEEDFAGNIEIKKTNYGMFGDEVAPTEEVYMSYRVDDVPLKGKKGSTKVEEYDEYTARPDEDGKMKDVEDGVPNDVLDDAGDPDSMTLKKADGGRIGFSAGGGKFLLSKLGINSTTTRFLEKVFGKEKYKNLIANDPEMHRGLLEVAEMFRSKDKEGLKMYMQKFLPHMDDEMVEDFIVGSGGTEGIAGQLIRLGSGRDYAGKLEMMQKLNNVKKLENLDVTDEMIRKPNSDGGRIGLFLGGPLVKNQLTSGKGLLREMLKFMSKGSTNAKSPKELLQLYNPKQFNKLLNNPKNTGKISPATGETANEMILNMIKKTKNDRSDMVGDLIGSARKIKKVDDDIKKYKQTIIKQMLDGGIDEDTAYSFAEKMAKEMKENAAPQLTSSPPKITEQGLLELENIQKNLITKDRKLQAQGGLTTMLGE